jgi:hypothetical protein
MGRASSHDVFQASGGPWYLHTKALRHEGNDSGNAGQTWWLRGFVRAKYLCFKDLRSVDPKSAQENKILTGSNAEDRRIALDGHRR